MSLFQLFRQSKRHEYEDTESERKHKSEKIKNLKNKNIVEIIEKQKLDDFELILVYQLLTFEKTFKWDKHIFCDEEEITALHLAATCPSSDALNILLSHGCPVELRTKSRGLSPFHFIAMYKGSGIENIDLLIDYGVNYNVKDVAGRTALHWACIRRYHRVARELVKIERFDINAKDYAGNTALMLSRNLGFEQGVSLLEPFDRKHGIPELGSHLNTHRQHRDLEFIERLREILEDYAKREAHAQKQIKYLQTQNEILKGQLDMFVHKTGTLSSVSKYHITGSSNETNVPYANSHSMSEPEAHNFGSRHLFPRDFLKKTKGLYRRDTSVWPRKYVSYMSGLNQEQLIHVAQEPKREHLLSEDRKKRIQSNITKLLDQCDANAILIKLFGRNIIDHRVYASINLMESNVKKIDHIIFDIIYRSSNEVYDDFVAILNEVGPRHLAALLDVKKLEIG